jgi:serine/threonine protein phosphatase 1
MAIYVTSDLHGLAPETLEQLLAKAGFTDADWLYILGDVIDRQNDGGVEMLKWLLFQPNVQLILGNHEAMLLSCDFVFDEITEDSIRTFSKEKMELLQNYMANGGDVTLKALRELNRTDRETLLEILDYLRDCPSTKAYRQMAKTSFSFTVALKTSAPRESSPITPPMN